MYGCPECKEKMKEYGELSSRISSLKYHEEDYDRMKGKGKFKKDHPDSKKMMDEMLNKKTEMLMSHMKHEMAEEEDEMEDKPSTGGVPVI